MKSLSYALICLSLSLPAFAVGSEGASGSPVAKVAGIPEPSGIYVLDDASNERAAANVYASGLTSSPAYLNDVTGHAIFVPIAKILPTITTWGQFNWDWSFLDTLVQIAVSHNKKFTIELETGFQSSSTTYLHSLPNGFAATCGTDCAPLFDVWAVGGTKGTCISSYVLLPWVPKVQQFWSAAAFSLAAHLKQTGVYDWLTLVHVPGLSVYDEELRLPTGSPSPTSADTLPCPDGRPAYPSVINDAGITVWQALGYSDSTVINGFKVIANAFAQAFPDRYLGLSLFPPGGHGIDFPNLTNDPVGYVASRIVKEVSAIAPGRVEIQADMLDANLVLAEVKDYASLYSCAIGWQSNKHGGTGAGCNGGGALSCDPDGPDGLYFQLLQNGALNGGTYVEVWSADVVRYPQSFAAAKSAGLYRLTGVSETDPSFPLTYDLQQNYPNPFNPTTEIRYEVMGVSDQASGMSDVKLVVYDVLGREVAVLVDEREVPGSYTVKFNAPGLASGVYLYRLQANNFVQTRTMLLLK